MPAYDAAVSNQLLSNTRLSRGCIELKFNKAEALILGTMCLSVFLCCTDINQVSTDQQVRLLRSYFGAQPTPTKV